MDEEAALKGDFIDYVLSVLLISIHADTGNVVAADITSSGLTSDEVDLALWKACQSGDTDAAFAAVEEGANVNKEHEQVSAGRPVVLSGLSITMFHLDSQP